MNLVDFLYLKDGLEILANEQTEIMHCGARCSLTLLDACTEDCGTYTCMAGNSVGQTSCHAKLTVAAGESQVYFCSFNFVKYTS